MLDILFAILGAGAFTIYIIIYLIFAPKKKRDKDGNLIFD